MPLEIERKFLVVSQEWRSSAGPGHRLRQAYIAETDRAVVRVRIEQESRAFLTIKSASPGRVRSEFEYPVPIAHAEALIELRRGSVLEKTRFIVPEGGRNWEVDVYSGDNAGLVVAEIELTSASEVVEFPAWLGAEITDEPRYYASRLALAPYRLWPEVERLAAPVGR